MIWSKTVVKHLGGGGGGKVDPEEGERSCGPSEERKQGAANMPILRRDRSGNTELNCDRKTTTKPRGKERGGI